MKNVFLVCCLVVIMTTAAFAVSPAKYQQPEIRQLVSFVNDAAALVSKNGAKAFAEFNQQNSKWWHGDSYVVVYDADKQIRACYPPHPEKVGQKMSAVVDPNGKPIGQWFLQIAGDARRGNEGWTFYQWTQPGHKGYAWKATFNKLAVSPDGKKYIISSGVYNFKLERQLVAGLVDEAAQLLAQKGKAAFATFNSAAGPFRFRDFYLFVDNEKGDELVNPDFPKIAGTNVWNLKDSKGKLVVQNYIKLAMSKGSGWLTYHFPKPGETKASVKHAYVRLAKSGSQTFIVGAGFYE